MVAVFARRRLSAPPVSRPAVPMPVSIRSRLVALVLAVLLPCVLGVAWLIGQTYAAERDANERRLRDTTRALSLVIDHELGRRQAIARVLAGSRWLDGALPPTPEALSAFENLARRAVEDTEGWVELRSTERTLLDTRGAPSERAQPLVDRPTVLPLRLDGGPHAELLQPVQRDGRTIFNIVVTIRPRELQRLIDAQQLPVGWAGTVMDNAGRVVARRPGGEAMTGRAGTPDLLARMEQAHEGLFNSVSLDGIASTGYYSTSPLGWSYISVMPREQFAGLLPRAVLHVATGAALLLALAVAGALWVSRGIARPARALREAAEQLQAGQPVQLQATGVAEFDEVARALDAASAAMLGHRNALEQQVAQAVERTRAAEQRAAHSQRVEALGRLTGGVAHDFNNLLGVISNSAHLVQRQAEDLPALRGPVAATLRAVEAGSQLTQHLLRFAGRRSLKPQPVELGRTLPELQDLLRSVLGRRVETTVRVEPGTRPVQVDPSELELALVNLALNARDAMPQGGELRVQARNAGPEDLDGLDPGAAPAGFVLLTVGDDGTGIDPEVADHVFEPFFTTKGTGQGTGLGLSQVHGFAVQSGGTARLASTPGFGTTVSLLLPACASGTEVAERAAATAGPRDELAGVQVLLVEDNEALGDVTAALLQAHGATVRRAAGAEHALRQLAAGAEVDLVLSDVVMPGSFDGLALARRLRRARPALPVVLITGYSLEATASDEFVVLRKPCPPAELLAALRAAVQRTSPAGT